MFEGESSKKNHPLLNNREKRIDIIKCGAFAFCLAVSSLCSLHTSVGALLEDIGVFQSFNRR